MLEYSQNNKQMTYNKKKREKNIWHNDYSVYKTYSYGSLENMDWFLCTKHLSK